MSVAIGVVDYFFFIGTLVVSMGIGIYFSVANGRGRAAFAAGDKTMGIWPITFSLLAASLSGISILGYPTEFYSYGLMMAEVIVSQIIFIPLFGFIIMPIFYRQKYASVYEYLEVRFKCRPLRILAMAIFLLDGVLYLGVVLFAPCIALNAVVGIPVWAAILGVGGCATIYTAIGGFQAVVWIEFFQSLIMISGMMAVVIKGSLNVGGFSEAWRIMGENGRLNFADFRLDPMVRQTSWGLFFGQGLFWGGIYSTYPVHVLRFCSMKSIKETRKAQVASGFVVAAMIVLAAACGTVIYATYASCDPIALGLISRNDQVLPYFVVQYLSSIPGLLGLFMAALFSGTLSSISSNLNAIATILWEDCLQEFPYFRKMEDKNQINVIKAVALLTGTLAIAFSFLVGSMGEILTVAITLAGGIKGPLIAIFLLGIFIPFAEKKGTTIGFVFSEIIMMIMATVSISYRKAAYPPLPTSTTDCPLDVAGNLTAAYHYKTPEYFEWPEKFLTFSYVLYPLLGCFLTVLIGILISMIMTSDDKGTTDHLDGLVHPLCLRLCGRQNGKEFDRQSETHAMSNGHVPH